MKGKHHRRDANKARVFADVEAALRAALNGEAEEKEEPPIDAPQLEQRIIRAPFVHRPQHHHKTTVRYSVRHHWGGNRFVVSYSEDTISELIAAANAKKDMTRKRYRDVVHLDTTHT